MSLNVLFFGAVKEAVGRGHLEIKVTQTQRISNVIDRLTLVHPKLASHKLFFAVNQEHVSEDRLVNDGDEIAIFTAVSGG